jgi:hypothetical protein
MEHIAIDLGSRNSASHAVRQLHAIEVLSTQIAEADEELAEKAKVLRACDGLSSRRRGRSDDAREPTPCRCYSGPDGSNGVEARTLRPSRPHSAGGHSLRRLARWKYLRWSFEHKDGQNDLVVPYPRSMKLSEYFVQSMMGVHQMPKKSSAAEKAPSMIW